LAKTGFQSQQASQPNPPDARVNLWRPADGPEAGLRRARDLHRPVA
jgi:hypothetical protein